MDRNVAAKKWAMSDLLLSTCHTKSEVSIFAHYEDMDTKYEMRVVCGS